MSDDAYSMESFAVEYKLEGVGKGSIYFYWRLVDGTVVTMCDNDGLTKDELIRVMSAVVDGCELTSGSNSQ